MHAYQCRLRNLQGDIIALLDSTGALVVEYKYDAWGKPISITGDLADTLGKRNPFRYRGYVYDEETGLYYLRSRYYNPEVGRFINADALLGNVGGLGSYNAYAYCANMPVIAADPSGQTAVETAIPIFYQLSQMDGCYPFGDFVGAFIVAGAYAIDAVTELVKPNTKEKTATKTISISTATASPTLAPDRKYQIAIAYGNIGVASVSPLLTEKRRI